MRTRKKQRIIIGTLCSILVGLAIGYAVLSSQLNIQGTGRYENVSFSLHYKGFVV